MNFMYVRLLLYSIFFFITIDCSSQTKTGKIWGPQVLDKAMQKPITGATISVNRKDYYPISEDGYAEIPLTNVAKFDTIYVSLLGYKTLKLPVENIEELPFKLELEVQVYNLETVEVRHKNEKLKETMVGADPTTGISHFFINVNTKYALYINNNAGQKGFIKEIYIRMHNRAGARKMPFKLTLYDKNTNDKYPNRELMEEIITQNSTNKKWFKIDLSNLNISIPENGFFIVFTTLPQAYYSNKKHNSGPFVNDKVPGIECTRDERDMNKENYSLTKTNYPGWNVLKGMEYQMQAKLLLIND